MKIGYLMNTYPIVSTTFIGREIAGLEKLGMEVRRYAIRPWKGTLIDASDILEQTKTCYLLTGSVVRLFSSVIFETVTNPARSFSAIRQLFRLIRNARGHVIKHIAYLMEAMVLRRVAARDGISHIHAHFSTNSAAVAMLSHTLGGPSYSFTIHGPDELFSPRENSLGLKIASARFVACISHFARSQAMLFSEQTDWPKLRIVHCGVRVNSYCRPVQSVAKKRVLFIGRLDAVKGATLLVDAFGRVRERHPGATLTIVGDGHARQSLKVQARELGLDAAFLGFQPQDAVAKCLQEADILALPSFAEGVPVVLMEAMASGIPVIASRIAGIPELVEDGVSGFVIPPGDIETLTNRLDALLSDPPLRIRMGEAGRAKVEAEFDIDRESAWLADLFAGNAQGLRPVASEKWRGSPSLGGAY